MRVVDDHAEGLAGVDALHAAGHAGNGLETRADRVGRQREGLPQRDDRERVVHVEPAGKPQLQPPVAARRGVRDAQPPRVLLDPGRADVSIRRRCRR